ncbi:interleukin 3 precursor [Limosa lapponica baueri]|uniref:Interleukin 3 n=1 Tax=Limosa lapponica baueri TaxID=1758121 RepID=A0A2I0TJR1_LIMLA|nr:interleukin 3 precursor [Limosa lapponica baueri]
MLVQAVALLSLGVLCSSAPMQATGPTDPGRHSSQEERSRALVGLIIREVLHDMQKLNLNAVSTVVSVNATVERCMHSHLKTFAATLAALDKPGKAIARKLDKVYKNVLPKGTSKTMPPNYTMEEGGDLTTYLDGFIKALKNSKEHSKERLIAHELQKIKDARKSCLKWMLLYISELSISPGRGACIQKGRAPKYTTFKMYLHFFLLLFSSGVSSYFLPLKEMLHLQKKVKSDTIREMLCLLEAENGPPKTMFFIPDHIRDKHCAYDNTKNFIQELQSMHEFKCMRKVEKGMEKLQTKCPILQVVIEETSVEAGR